MLRVFTYLRCASGRPAPGADVDPFGPWFEAHPYATRGADFDDLGVSGLTLPDRRPGFAALLAAIDADKPDFILVYSWACLGRSPLVSSFARHLIDRRGVDLLSVDAPASVGAGALILA